MSVATGNMSDEILISCEFISDTDLIGYLAILYPVVNNTGTVTYSSVKYHVTERRTDEGTHEDIVANLTASVYSVSLYALRDDGLPAVSPFSFPMIVSLVNGSTGNLCALKDRSYYSLVS